MSEYIIVIDVCNNRARKAYEKGLSDLDTIWGQLMLFAKSKDDEALDKWQSEYDAWEKWNNERKEKRAAELAEYRKAAEDYDRELVEWEASKKTFWGVTGSAPRYPSYPCEGFSSMLSTYADYYCPVNPYARYQDYYESVKKELTNKCNLADAAIGPFRMTERDVQAMVAWEDGSRIQDLLGSMDKKWHWWDGIPTFYGE